MDLDTIFTVDDDGKKCSLSFREILDGIGDDCPDCEASEFRSLALRGNKVEVEPECTCEKYEEITG